MKKLLLSLSAFALIMSNCTNEEIENVVSEQSKTAFKAVMEEPVVSRATVDDSGVFTWTVGDVMMVNTSVGLKEFTYDSSTGKFGYSEDVTIKDYAIYPSTVDYANGKVTLPDSYELGSTTRNVNAIMLAASFEENTESIEMKHLGGVVRFSFKDVPVGVDKLVFTADNTITGEFDIREDQINAPVQKFEEDNKVTLSFTATNAKQDMNFFVPVPVGSYVMKVALYAGNDLIYEKEGTNSNSINRKTLLLMPQVDCGEFWYHESFSEYTIKTVAQLKEFRDKVNSGVTFAGKTVKLGASLDLNNENWTPIGTLSPENYFSGTFDGCEQVISNLNVSVADGAAGLFGAVQNCTEIKNVKLSNVKVSSNHYVGALIGWIQENGSSNTPLVTGCSVENVEVVVVPNLLSNDKYDNGDKAGALIGYAASDMDISYCSVNNATVTGYRDLGGIVGYANSTDTYGYVNIANCTVSGLTIVQNLANGYKNEYPVTLGAIYGGGTSPDVMENSNGIVSLTIKNCPPAYAQGALDAANTPRTIELTEGNFENLLLRINEASELTDYYYIMGNYDSYYFGQENWQYAKRTINDLTIKGVEGTIINSLTTSNARDDEGNVKGTRNNMFEIKNLTISGVTIADKISFSSSSVSVATSATTSVLQPHVTIDGLTIENCKTTGDDKTSSLGRKLLGIANTGTTSNVKNIVISGCVVTDMYQGVYIVDGENIKVDNCTFSGLAHNAVHLNKFCSGTINVTGNTMSNIGDRPIRLNGIQSGNVTITGNSITASGDSDGEYYKASTMGSSVNITWNNNTADGVEIVLSDSGNDKVGKKQTNE